jgi:DNA ligase 1
MKNLHVVLFDMISLDPTAPAPQSTTTYKERYNALRNMINNNVEAQRGNPYKNLIKVCESKICHNQDELDHVFNSYVKDGYEGMVVRNITGSYLPNQRSQDAMKRKPFMDAEYEIADMCMVNDGRLRVELILNNANIHFGAVWNVGIEKAREIMATKNAYIGKFATARYVTLTDRGIPRSAEIKGIYVRV